MARKFLYFVAFCILVFVAGRLALQFYPEQLSRAAFSPKGHFQPLPPVAQGRYGENALWLARPGLSGDPVHWNPPGLSAPAPVRAAVFFVHPTTYLEREVWNAPIEEPHSADLANRIVRIYASPFAGAQQVWAPRYRQAAFGVFLNEGKEPQAALDLAYGDLLQAFDTFIAAAPKDLPIVLAGHSQGAYHLRRLMAARLAGTPLARRVAAVYVIGWPVALDHDLPAMGLPACTAPDQPGCVMSWLSYAEPGDPSMMVRAARRMQGLDGQGLQASRFLCSNPLTGMQGGSAPASANPGTLVPDAQFRSGALKPGHTGAACRSDDVLSLGGEPEMGPVVMPGGNYHAYDIPLFWAALRADYARRVAAWRP